MLNDSLRIRLAKNYYTLMFAALDHHLIPRQTNYARFVVLGRPRTGSTFLRSAMNKHRQIFTFGELFRHDLISWEPHLGSLSAQALAEYSKRPLDFIDAHVYRSYPAHVRAVGFKLFYHHAHNEAMEPIWSHLINDRSIRILHIKRRNLLKTFISHKTAWQTGAWKQTANGGQTRAASNLLSYEECEEEFRTALHQEQIFDTRFAEHPKLEVVYEDLVKNFDVEIRRIEQFLGVQVLPVRPTTLKQAKQPLTKQIVNYYELKERFQQTQWAHFFTE